MDGDGVKRISTSAFLRFWENEFGEDKLKVAIHAIDYSRSTNSRKPPRCIVKPIQLCGGSLVLWYKTQYKVQLHNSFIENNKL
jgi:predicted ATP-grasp superfamily ATP-dependent carboligase